MKKEPCTREPQFPCSDLTREQQFPCTREPQFPPLGNYSSHKKDLLKEQNNSSNNVENSNPVVATNGTAKSRGGGSGAIGEQVMGLASELANQVSESPLEKPEEIKEPSASSSNNSENVRLVVDNSKKSDDREQSSQLPDKQIGEYIQLRMEYQQANGGFKKSPQAFKGYLVRLAQQGRLDMGDFQDLKRWKESRNGNSGSIRINSTFFSQSTEQMRAQLGHAEDRAFDEQVKAFDSLPAKRRQDMQHALVPGRKPALEGVQERHSKGVCC